MHPTKVRKVTTFFNPSFRRQFKKLDSKVANDGLQPLFRLIQAMSAMCLTGRSLGILERDVADILPVGMESTRRYFVIGSAEHETLLALIRNSSRVEAHFVGEWRGYLDLSSRFYRSGKEQIGHLAAHTELSNGRCSVTSMGTTLGMHD